MVKWFMDRWSGVVKVPLSNNSRNYYGVAASLCFSSTSKTLTMPSANAIFFNGDRVEGSRNPVIERLSDLQKIADILVSKFGGSINAWVVEASIFNGPFAVYEDFLPAVSKWGEPKSYSPIGFPASAATISLLSNCLEEAKNVVSGRQRELCSSELCSSNMSPSLPKTILLGFSKGGTVLNQIVSELGSLEFKSMASPTHIQEQTMERETSGVEKDFQIIPRTKEGLLNSITEIHYVDVGLNALGAYITDHKVIQKILKRILDGAPGIRFVIHGTPRQWCDSKRAWICDEKEKLIHLLESEAHRSNGKLKVCERLYFAGRPPDLRMHFEIIEKMDVG